MNPLQAVALGLALAGGEESYRLSSTPLPQEDAAEAPSIPAALREVLDPRGHRFSNAAGEPLYELWLAREVRGTAPAATPLGVSFPQIPFGTFVGVLRSYGKEVDYRGDRVAQGFYVLRLVQQPDDGNHMGTTDTRDFLILTGLEEDRDPAVVREDFDELSEAACEAASADHPNVLYVVEPPGPAPSEPAVFHREAPDDWGIDLTVPVRRAGAPKAEPLRLGILLVGHVDV